MTHTAAVERKDRHLIVDKLFGEKGLICILNENDFDENVRNIIQFVKEKAPKFCKYMTQRLIPLIKQSVFMPGMRGDVLTNWTNNNAESANHILKISIDWKPRNLCELTNKIYETVQSEYNDVKRSLIGHGNFLLCEHFSKYYVEPAVWSMKTTEEQDRHFLQFMKDMRCSTVPVKPKTGKLVHASPKQIGRIP